MLGFNGSSNFLGFTGSINIRDISHSFFVLPRVSNIEEEPVINIDVVSVHKDDLILVRFLDSESIGG
jgi:hypothetical protein